MKTLSRFAAAFVLLLCLAVLLTPVSAAEKFTDVPSDAFYAEAVAWAVEKGVTTGTSETTFGPEKDCTRAQVVTFLWRASGSPEPKSSDDPFTDVKEADYCYKAVLWAVENEITKGTGDTAFSPKKTCTRAEVVTFLWRAAKQPGVENADNPFADVGVTDYFHDAVLWAVESDITRGTGAAAFSPKKTCTRAQVVTFLFRARPQASAMAYRFADRGEAAELLLQESGYYTNFSQNDLNYRVQKLDATLDEWKQLVRQETRDFTDEEKAAIDEAMEIVLGQCAERGYHLPELEDVVFAKTTMHEESDAGAYTHGTHIFLGESLLAYAFQDDPWYREYFRLIVAHELFHCLTRNDPDFRRDMYGLLGFTVGDADVTFSKEVKDVIISNPDVGHHDAFAAFEIGGETKNCVVIFTANPFEKPGDSFFDSMQTRLVPLDDPSVSYSSDDAANFWDVFGRNTDYVIDPEETLADNFSYAVVYGPDREYATKELIESIDAYLRGR